MKSFMVCELQEDFNNHDVVKASSFEDAAQTWALSNVDFLDATKNSNGLFTKSIDLTVADESDERSVTVTMVLGIKTNETDLTDCEGEDG